MFLAAFRGHGDEMKTTLVRVTYFGLWASRHELTYEALGSFAQDSSVAGGLL